MDKRSILSGNLPILDHYGRNIFPSRKAKKPENGGMTSNGKYRPRKGQA
jgi:hypothetical protein